MEEAVKHGGDGGGVAEELGPIFDGSVGGEQGAGALVASHDELEQIFGGGGGELLHAEVVDDEQGNGREELDVLLSRAVECGVCEVFEQDVRFSVEDAHALLDHGAPDRLCKMALARSWRSEEQSVFASVHELSRGELVDESSVHLAIEVEVEVVDGSAAVSELGRLRPSFEQTISPASQFVVHEHRDEVDGCDPFGLGLQDSRFETLRHRSQS